MTNLFGNKFISNYGTRDNGAWFGALKDLTVSDLQYGFEKMLNTYSDAERNSGEVWPPNGKEFRLMCERKLTDFGLPNVHRAFAEMEKNHYLSVAIWSHPLVCLAARKIEVSDDMARNESFAIFQKMYDDLCQRYMQGENISLPNCYLLTKQGAK